MIGPSGGMAGIVDAFVRPSGPLTVDMRGFNWEVGGAKGTQVAITGLAVVDNATNYLFLDSTGVFTINQTGYPVGTHLPIYRVITLAGNITQLIDDREFLTATSPTGDTPSDTVTDETTWGIDPDAGSATEYSRGDHTHGTPDAPIIPSPAASVTDERTFGITPPVVGVSTNYAREDHTHGTPPNPGATIETTELYLKPEGATSGATTRPAQTLYDGLSVQVRKAVQFNRIIIAISTVSTPGDGVVAIYQRAGGVSGVAALKASVVWAVTANGLWVLTPAEALPISLDPGVAFVLFGKRPGGTFAFRTSIVQSLQLITNPADIENDVHPTTFTTNISTAAFPATLDPRQTTAVPPGGATTATAADIALQIRLKKV